MLAERLQRSYRDFCFVWVRASSRMVGSSDMSWRTRALGPLSPLFISGLFPRIPRRWLFTWDIPVMFDFEVFFNVNLFGLAQHCSWRLMLYAKVTESTNPSQSLWYELTYIESISANMWLYRSTNPLHWGWYAAVTRWLVCKASYSSSTNEADKLFPRTEMRNTGPHVGGRHFEQRSRRFLWWKL
jgi:hypothetical protein